MGQWASRWIHATRPYGNAIQHGGNEQFWEDLVPHTRIERQFKSHDYDYFPRGRVVLFECLRFNGKTGDFS